MSPIQARWIGGQQYIATDDAGHVVVTDPDDKGFKPPELLLVAVAGCAGVDVVRILEKKRQKFSSVEVSVNKQNAPEAPWTIERIEVEWVVKGKDLSEKAVKDAVRLSEDKYCSVTASLTSELVTTVRVVNEDQEGGR